MTWACVTTGVGQSHTYARSIYGVFGREITRCTVVCGVYLRFWPTLVITSDTKTDVRVLSAQPDDVGSVNDEWLSYRRVAQCFMCRL
jgi:hypothetical protein